MNYYSVVILTILVCYHCNWLHFVANGADVTTVRPYQFGFDIEEQQHRFEKRDERGIVMGEFGFITADGIYHVTVYATDEQGRFKILAMKSYPYKSRSIEMVVSPQKKLTTTTTTTTAATPKLISTLAPRRELPKFNFKNEACSGCFLTNIQPKEDIIPPIINSNNAKSGTIVPLGKSSNAVISKNEKMARKIVPLTLQHIDDIQLSKMSSSAKNTLTTIAGNRKYSNTLPTTSGAITTLATTNNPTFLTRFAPATQTPPQLKTSSQTQQANKTPTTALGKARSSGKATLPGSTSNASSPQTILSTLAAPSIGSIGKASAAKPTGFGGGLNASNNRKLSDRNNQQPTVGGVKSVRSDAGDLYHFKYTLDYNGHEETGGRNGNKIGNYFVLGDDNVERKIEYIANEFGFQPHIKWRRLSPSELPKSSENTLKDYEFIWFKDQS